MSQSGVPLVQQFAQGAVAVSRFFNPQTNGATVGLPGSPPPNPETDTNSEEYRRLQAEQDAAAKKEQTQAKSRSATIFTSGRGLLSEPTLARKTLLGY